MASVDVPASSKTTVNVVYSFFKLISKEEFKGKDKGADNKYYECLGCSK